jgi:hypothetical protein
MEDDGSPGYRYARRPRLAGSGNYLAVRQPFAKITAGELGCDDSGAVIVTVAGLC